MFFAPSKKTLSNEFNVKSSSDFRQLNADITPIISPSWNLSLQTQLGSAVSLGSPLRPWKDLYAQNVQIKYPSLPEAVASGTAPTAAPRTATNNAYWHILSGTPTTRVVRRWNGTAWEIVTNALPVGSVLFNLSDLRLYIYEGASRGWRSSFVASNVYPA